MDLRVEYFYDEESGHWGFVVPSLNIVGGGAETREEAEEEAREAILFTLEGDDEEPVPAAMWTISTSRLNTHYPSRAWQRQ